MTDHDFLALACPRCGGELRQESNYAYRCICCNRPWENQALHSYERIFESVEEALRAQRMEDMARYKRMLYTETRKEFISSKETKSLCKKVLAIDDTDFYALFYLASCQDDESLGQFAAELNFREHGEDLDEILEYLLKGLKPSWILPVSHLIEAYKENSNMERYNHYREIFHEKAEAVQEGVFETTLPRDIFVAYSSKDIQKVMELVEILENKENAFSCFVAARNLRHGIDTVENYKTELQNAMTHCKSVVFVSSKHSRSLSCDAYKEIVYIQDHEPEKLRVEYLIEPYTGTNVENTFKHFFEGREYCTSPHEVAKRIAKLFTLGEETMLTPKDFNGTVKYCVECKQKNALSSRFCKKCKGTKFISTYEEYIGLKSKYCKKCGNPAEKDSYYCDHCGSEEFFPTKQAYDEYVFALQKAEADRKAQEAERRAREEAERKARVEAERKAQKEAEHKARVEAERKARAEAEQKAKAEAERKARAEAERRAQEEERKAREKAERQAKPRKGRKAIAVFCAVVVILSASIAIGATALSNADHDDTTTSNHTQTTTTSATTETTIETTTTEKPVEANPLLSNFAYNGTKLTGYIGSATEVVIPDYFTEIGKKAFQNCSSLTSIKIPNSVTSIGEYAFSNCSSLTSITIPNSVKAIGGGAFSYCSGLTSITIPNSVTSIGISVFQNCSSLTSITIPDSVTSIGLWAFADCSGLTSIKISDSLASIGLSAFFGCSSLTNITIPDSVTSIGFRAFYGCSSLTSITIPDSVTSIGEMTFYNCSSLTSITIPNSVTAIGDSAFYDCGSLTRITIPDSVTAIGNSAFSGCSSLTRITIPDSVIWIEDAAFYGCSGLMSIRIPKSVEEMGEYVFRGCSNLQYINCEHSQKPTGWNAVWYNNHSESIIRWGQ